MKPLPNISRDRAVDIVASSPACRQLQLECPAEDIDSLARTVVDTAYSEGLDYTVTVMHPERACAATRRVWRECAKALGQPLPSERISALLSATSRARTLTFELAAAGSVLDKICQAAQQDPRLIGEARYRFECLVETMAQLAVEAPALSRDIKAGLELRPEPDSTDNPSTFRAHEVS